MLRVGSKIIEAEVVDILKDLKVYFAKNYIERFRDIHNKGSYIMTNCPVHKSGKEQHPSCGILKRDEDGKPAGWVHCFSCSYSKTFDKMISDVMGINDDGEFGRKWLLDNFVNYVDDIRNIDLDIDRDIKVVQPKYVTDEELDKYRWTHPYWAKRKISDEVCVKFDLGYDKSSNSITMPVWDYYGNCVGVTKRRVDKKVFYIPDGMVKPVYLLNFGRKEGWSVIYLCESQINALYLNSIGLNACACFGTGTTQQAEDLIRSGVRSIVFCFDGDNAGRKGRERMYRKLSERVLCTYIDLPEGKDVNDLSEEQIMELVNNQKNF